MQRVPASQLRKGDVVDYGDYTGTLLAEPTVIYQTDMGRIVAWDFARDGDLARFGRQRDWSDAINLIRVLHRAEPGYHEDSLGRCYPAAVGCGLAAKYMRQADTTFLWDRIGNEFPGFGQETGSACGAEMALMAALNMAAVQQGVLP